MSESFGGNRDQTPSGRHPVVEQILSEIEQDGLGTPKLDEQGRARVNKGINRARAMAYVKFSK